MRPSIDMGRAAFAVALAVLLYFVALSETNPEGRNQLSFTVPVQVVNAPPGLVVVNQPPQVRLWVRAPVSVFGRLRADSFTAQVDASGAQAGDNDNLPISVTSSDPDVREVVPDPSSVRLRLEEIREQALPVRINLIGQVLPGYQLGQPTADPSRINAAGASSFVGRAVEAVVDVPVDRVTVSINGVFTPRIVDERGNDLRDLNLRAQPPAVTVSVPITQQTQYKEVGIRVVTTGNPAPGYVLEPLEVSPATATLRGDSPDLEAVNFVETQLVDVSGISGTTVRNVPLNPPARTLLLQPGQTVTVTIRVAALTASQTVRVPPSVINQSPNVQLARPPDPVSVTVRGPAPAFVNLALNASDFRVVLDVAGRGAGRWEIEPRVQLPTGLNLDSVQPARVTVELREVAPTPQPTATSAPAG
ncbi:MAG: CdaR family protein [Chloroflexota bacterium]|nr:CdaR family protein [Chloroflexota bacterium]